MFKYQRPNDAEEWSGVAFDDLMSESEGVESEDVESDPLEYF